MNTRDGALRLVSITETVRLYVSFELGLAQWRLTFGNGQRMTERVVEGGDYLGVVEALRWAKGRLGLPEDCEVLSCYEAGRDGFYLHWWLEAQGGWRTWWWTPRALRRVGGLGG